MPVEKKIQKLKHNKERLNAYRKAIDTLRVVGIEEILVTLSLPNPVEVGHPQGTQLAAAELHQSLGYQKCLGDLFGLEDLIFSQTDRPVPDFGANEKLGLTEDEAKGLL